LTVRAAGLVISFWSEETIILKNILKDDKPKTFDEQPNPLPGL